MGLLGVELLPEDVLAEKLVLPVLVRAVKESVPIHDVLPVVLWLVVVEVV